MQPWETACLASHTKVPAASTKVSVPGHCSHKIWFSKKRPARQQEQTLGVETGRSLSEAFSHRRDGLQGLGCQAKQTLTSNLLLHAPNTLAQPRGERRGTKFPSFPQPQSNSEVSAAEASQDSPASGQVRCQTGCCWKSEEERKQTLIR